MFLDDGEGLRLLATGEHVQFLGEPVNCKPEFDLGELNPNRICLFGKSLACFMAQNLDRVEMG